jgi:hypothetical protein
MNNEHVHPVFASILNRQLGRNLGPLSTGHYVQIGMGLGFYVPERDYADLQALANVTRRTQFLGITKTGEPLFGTREEIAAHPESAGLIAWIAPQGDAR